MNKMKTWINLDNETSITFRKKIVRNVKKKSTVFIFYEMGPRYSKVIYIYEWFGVVSANLFEELQTFHCMSMLQITST